MRRLKNRIYPRGIHVKDIGHPKGCPFSFSKIGIYPRGIHVKDIGYPRS